MRNLLIAFAFLLAGCAPHQLYRPNTNVCTSPEPVLDCREHALQEYVDDDNPESNYLLAFIEFDDQGQVFDRTQMNDVLKAINEKAGLQDLLMVVFVHGWKHSAKPEDTNIDTFRNSLKWLSAMESRIGRDSGRAARQVVGVYLGWRGESVTLPVIKQLSFWERKNTAHKVGRGGVTEVLNQLELIRDTRNAISDSKTDSTHLVVVGHSFGGAVIYTAVSQISMERFVKTRGPSGALTDVLGFGDLIVLINPAFEAMQITPVSDAANERRTYFCSQLPALVILTSEADRATGNAFPVGRWFSTVFENHRDTTRTNPVTGEPETISQRQVNVTAVGHFEPYRTHDLRATGKISPEIKYAETLQSYLDLYYDTRERWQNDAPGSVIPFGKTELTRTDDSVGRNPYLVVKVDKALIKDHNDLDDERIANFVRQLILLSSQIEDESTGMVECGNAMPPKL